MRKLQNNWHLWLTGLFFLSITACKKAGFQEKNLPPVKAYFNQPASILEVPVSGTYTKDNDNVTVAVEAMLSGAAPNSFIASLNANTDTVAKMIGAGLLPANTFVIPATDLTIPSLVEFNFGTQKSQFSITIPTVLFELNFTKKMAIAIEMSHPNKGNTIDPLKKIVVVLLNPAAIINQLDIHYLSFNLGGASPLSINPTNSTNAGSFINIPLKIDLSGSVGAAFSVNINPNTDTVNKLIANATLLNTIPIPPTNYSVPNSVKIGLNQSTATFTVQLNVSDLLKNLDKRQAFALTLNNPEKYQIAENKKTIVVVVDPLTILDDVTGLLKNTAQPFAYATLDPVAKRWGKLADWISNDAANNYKSQLQYGSYDANNGTNIALESFSPDRPAITNGKIYQTITLPAGIYTLTVNLRAGSNASGQNAYVAVVDGTSMPDVALLAVPANSLGNKKFTNVTGAYAIPFTLVQLRTVTIGFCATLSGNNSYNINNVKLTRQLN